MKLKFTLIFFLISGNVIFGTEKTNFFKFSLEIPLYSSLSTNLNEAGNLDRVLSFPKYYNTVYPNSKKRLSTQNIWENTEIKNPKRALSFNISYQRLKRDFSFLDPFTNYNFFIGVSENRKQSDLSITRFGNATSNIWDSTKGSKLIGIGNGIFDVKYRELTLGLPFYQNSILILPKFTRRNFKYSVQKQAYGNVYGTGYSGAWSDFYFPRVKNLKANSFMNYVGVLLEASLNENFKVFIDYATAARTKGSFQDHTSESLEIQKNGDKVLTGMGYSFGSGTTGMDYSFGRGDLFIAGRNITLGVKYEYDDNIELYFTKYSEVFEFSQQKTFEFNPTYVPYPKREGSKVDRFISPSLNTLAEYVSDSIIYCNNKIQIDDYRFGSFL